MKLTTEELISSKEWNKIVKKSVENAIGSKLDGNFTAANYPAGFNYAVKQQYYNRDSLSTLDSLVTVTNDIPTLSGTFSSLYKNVISNLSYDFSTKDQEKISQEETALASMKPTIIQEYIESELDETPDEYASIIYIIKRIKEVTGRSFDNMDYKEHPELTSLCNKLSEYTKKGRDTSQLQNAWSLADDRMVAIINHIKNPAQDNGGIKTDIQNYNIGWNKLPETEQLLASLKNGSTINISFSADNFNENTSSLHFESDVKANIPISWFFHMTVDHEHSFVLSQYARNESNLSVSIAYKGVSTLSAIPAPLSDNNNTGWFAGDILTEAAKKSGTDATGYQLNGSEFDPKKLFGIDGQLRRMKTFVISQQPVITLHFSKFDSSEMQKIFTQSTDVSFQILGGVIRGEHNNDYSFTNYSYNESKESLDVTITPAPIDVSGSIGKQTAYVLGGIVEYY